MMKLSEMLRSIPQQRFDQLKCMLYMQNADHSFETHVEIFHELTYREVPADNIFY